MTYTFGTLQEHGVSDATRERCFDLLDALCQQYGVEKVPDARNITFYAMCQTYLMLTWVEVSKDQADVIVQDWRMFQQQLQKEENNDDSK